MKKERRTLAQTLASLKAKMFAGSEEEEEEENTEEETMDEDSDENTEQDDEEGSETEDSNEESEGSETDENEESEGEGNSKVKASKANAAKPGNAETVSISKVDYENLVSAASQWQSNKKELETLREWKNGLAKGGQGARADAGDNGGDERKVSRATKAAIEAKNRRKRQ
ncbi:hypothetical protein LAG90_15720 [Marinilongibacter aquaticus]|uniref:hypothetical protein n=1 Tax=Marinilongibacter aquaticus TaxID=2975157 RepID=UPI0021BD979B|nr:hypothetical protein [Marinilongibacter aquaticus]UBM58252.1 hypothetical protein LAG90_15720 [Marinilongibacter aquaticus]